MRKRRWLLLLLLPILAAAWYFAPKTFLRGVDPAAVQSILVFDGTTGVGFTVDDPDDVRLIVEKVQEIRLRRDGISLGRMGYGFRLDFVGEDEKALAPPFCLNGEGVIRKDPFFYRCDGGLPFGELHAMEEKIQGN